MCPRIDAISLTHVVRPITHRPSQLLSAESSITALIAISALLPHRSKAQQLALRSHRSALRTRVALLAALRRRLRSASDGHGRRPPRLIDPDHTFPLFLGKYRSSLPVTLCSRQNERGGCRKLLLSSTQKFIH